MSDVLCKLAFQSSLFFFLRQLLPCALGFDLLHSDEVEQFRERNRKSFFPA